MSGRLVTVAIVLAVVGSTTVCAPAATLYGRSPSAGLGRSVGHVYGLSKPPARSRSGIGSDPGSHYGGLNQPESGWYPGGFGGTSTPGWGYHFAPGLGGLGR
jgi:hypothetical protein